jgi:hypothetical protein
MAGTTHFRVTKIAAIDGMPKTRLVLILTRWSLYLGIAPTRLVTPTMNKEYAEAMTAST